MPLDLTIGQEYRRSDLHNLYGGSRQGGISPSRSSPTVFLITSPAGEQHGYQYDGPQPDGTYWYTGEGQLGDMEFMRGNKAIRDAEANGKELHLFEETRSAHVRYLGPVQCVGHHYASAPDRSGTLRRVIVFELAFDNTDPAGITPPTTFPESEKDPELESKTLPQLRELALRKAAAGAPPAVRKVNAYRRSQAVKLYVLRRANGVCEACKQPAPFETAKGSPYLEPHHMRRVADGGPDHPRWVAAVCPNCHRRVHHGKDGDEYNEVLAAHVGSLEQS